MSDPTFVHLRLHSEYSIVDGIVRIDDAVAAAADDGMPALALTDLANVFGMVKFYKAARAAGVKPIIGCDVWITQRPNATRRPGRCCWPRTAQATCSCPTAVARLPDQPASRPRRIEARMVRRGDRRPDRALRRAAGDVGRRWRRATSPGPKRPRANGRRCFRSASISSCSAPGAPRTRRWSRATVALGATLGAAGGRHAPGAVRQARGFPRARGARVHRRRLRARRHAPAAPLHRRAALQDAGGDGGAVRRPAGGARQHRRDRAPLQPRRFRSASNHLPAFPTPAGVTHRRPPAPARPAPDSSGAWRSSTRMPAMRDGEARRVRARASSSRSGPSCRWASPATS